MNGWEGSSRDWPFLKTAWSGQLASWTAPTMAQAASPKKHDRSSGCSPATGDRPHCRCEVEVPPTTCCSLPDPLPPLLPATTYHPTRPTIRGSALGSRCLRLATCTIMSGRPSLKKQFHSNGAWQAPVTLGRAVGRTSPQEAKIL